MGLFTRFTNAFCCDAVAFHIHCLQVLEETLGAAEDLKSSPHSISHLSSFGWTVKAACWAVSRANPVMLALRQCISFNNH